MHILITNDDGYQAPGLKALYHALKDDHHISVIAPDRERSATSHRLTIHEPLRAIPFDNGMKGFAVNGTPADCIKLGVSQLISQKPDWVISGINPGANTGFNAFYSGTVAAAREAVYMSIPAIAVSITYSPNIDFKGAGKLIHSLIKQFSKKVLPAGTLFNINIPACPVSETKGLRVVRQAIYHMYEKYEKRKDPRKMSYYWIGDEKIPVIVEDITDIGAVSNNYIAIAPLSIDMTDEPFLQQMKSLEFDN